MISGTLLLLPRMPACAGLLALCALLAGGWFNVSAGAGAEQPVGPSEFRAYAEGYTLYFEESGAYYGAESYAPGDRALWQFRGGDCISGTWRAHGAQLCFRYEDAPDEVCWRMLRQGGDLVARLLGDGPNAGMELRVVRRDRTPLRCGGPAV